MRDLVLDLLGRVYHVASMTLGAAMFLTMIGSPLVLVAVGLTGTFDGCWMGLQVLFGIGALVGFVGGVGEVI